MHINTIDESFEIHDRTLLHIMDIEIKNLCLKLEKQHDLNWYELNVKLYNALGRDIDPNDNQEQLNKLISYLNFEDRVKTGDKYKTQGGLAILMNTILQNDPDNKNKKILTLLGGSLYSGFVIDQEMLVSFLNYIKQMISDNKDKVYYDESIFKETISSNEDEFFYITSEDERYIDKGEVFSLVEIMKDDEKLATFRNIIIEHELEELEDIEDYWFENILDKNDKIEFIKSEYGQLNDKISDLFFENNFNILHLFK